MAGWGSCYLFFANWCDSFTGQLYDGSEVILNQPMCKICRHKKLECGTWYHHPRRLQCVLSRNLRTFKVSTWHYLCHHNLKNNCIWDNLQYCLLGPRSPSKPVMLTFDLQSRKVLFIEIVSSHVSYNLERQLWYWHLLTRHCHCNLLPESTSPKHEYREKLWGHPVTSSMTSSP